MRPSHYETGPYNQPISAIDHSKIVFKVISDHFRVIIGQLHEWSITKILLFQSFRFYTIQLASQNLSSSFPLLLSRSSIVFLTLFLNPSYFGFLSSFLIQWYPCLDMLKPSWTIFSFIFPSIFATSKPFLITSSLYYIRKCLSSSSNIKTLFCTCCRHNDRNHVFRCYKKLS